MLSLVDLPTCGVKEMYRTLHQLANSNENTVYNLTGCLSSCDKFEYEIQPYTPLTNAVFMPIKVKIYAKELIKAHNN